MNSPWAFYLIIWGIIGIGNLIKCIAKTPMTWFGYWCAYTMTILLLLDRVFGG